MSRCQDKTDLKIVTLCPTSKEEWESAAEKKNCDRFVSQETDGKQYEYHCIINAFLNETLEVCAPKKLIFGHCTEFYVAGGLLQNHQEAKCNESFPRCGRVYSSADAYKYPDCYKMVYDNRNKDYTTYLPPEKTNDEEDNGVTIAAIINVVVAIVAISVAVILIKKKLAEKKRNKCDKEEIKHLTDIEAVIPKTEEKRTGKEGNECDEEEVKPLKNIEADIPIMEEKHIGKKGNECDEEEVKRLKDIKADNPINEEKRTGKMGDECDEEEVKHLKDIEAVIPINEGEESIKYFHFEAKNFEHFKYVYNLTRNYTQNDEIQLEDIIIKIGVVGKFTDDNLNLFPKGKTNLTGKLQNVWEAVPVLCFQNDLSVQSALETLRQSSAFHHILVTSEPVCKTNIGDDSITIIGQTKEEIMKNITTCLEQPLRHMLEQLLEDPSNKDSSTGRFLSKSSGVIKALLKEMTFDDNEETVIENLPDDIQEYLLRSDGFERAELSPSSLDVLVDKTTDDKLMKDDLTKLNPGFLERFPLTIQKGTLIKEITGGLVMTTENEQEDK